MTYRIIVDGTTPALFLAGPDVVRRFVVFGDAGDEPCLSAIVGISQMHALGLFSLTAADRSTRVVDEPLLARALALYAIPRIEAGLRDGSFAEDMDRRTPFVELIHNTDEVGRLRRLIDDHKLCRYLERGADDDDTCRAGHDAKKAAKVPLATTPHLCRACTMPDRRIACSALHHVTTFPQDGAVQPTGGLCGEGKRDFDPQHCRPGENECWRRVVRELAREEVVQLSPLALHEAFDYLDSVWRNAFDKQPLLRLNVLELGGQLATPCSSKEDFHKKVNCIVDTFDAFQVPGKGGTLDRMAEHLRNWGATKGLTSEDFTPVREAIDVLKKVTRLRAGILHSDEPARRSFEDAQVALGVTLPSVSYTDTWNRLVARVAEMLAIVRQFIRAGARETADAPPAPPSKLA